MNSVIRIFLVSVLCAFFALISGCAKQIPPYDSSTGTNMPEGRDIQYNNGESGVITEEMGPQVETLDSSGANNGGADSFEMSADQNSDEYKKLHGRSSAQLTPIYFDFDQASIPNDQITSIENNADYLKNNPADRVVIEGNCDERGTNEYNIALGERRALNARNYLLQLGVEENQLRTVSYGEERPLFPESDEFSWSQNRRDDFILE